MHRSIPTPSFNAVDVGPFTLHMYAICILLGIFIAIAMGRLRYAARGGNPDDINEVAAYAIPAGIIGGRIYHVITTPELYFGSTGTFSNAFKIWEGGLGIWGAISLGALVAYLVFRVKNFSLSFAQFADALAPGILIAQGVGRFGNWFNGELYGSPTNLPWGLSIPGTGQTYHPTFLYEALWCFIGAALLIRVGKSRALAPGKTFLRYILIYTAGRFWIELLRIDAAHTFWGVRLNNWVGGAVFAATLYFYLRKNKKREVE